MLILFPGLTLPDAETLPTISHLMQRGSSALMSSRVGRPMQVPFSDIDFDPLTSGYVTLATGSRAAAGPEISQIVQANELLGPQEGPLLPGKSLWAGFHQMPTPNTGLVAPWMEIAKRQAKADPYSVPIGQLGDLLDQDGITTDVIGNADTFRQLHREAAVFVMDSSGRAPSGSIGPEMTSKDPRFPYGVRTNIPKVMSGLSQALRTSRFIVIETGDPARYARYQNLATASARRTLKRLTFRTADSIVAGVLKRLPENYKLIVTSPGQTEDPDIAGPDRLAPLIVFQRGASPGLLASSSTRRLGVVVNTDLATSIASWLGGPASIGGGRPMTRVSSPHPIAELSRVYQESAYQSRARNCVYAFVYASCAALVLAALLLPSCGLRRRWGSALPLFPPAVFMAMLLATLVQPSPAMLLTIMFTAGALSCVAGYVLGGTEVAEALAAIAILTAFGAAAAGLFPHAAGSYEIQGGARFYGVGNEYGGFFVGAAFFLAASPFLLRSWPGRLAGLAIVIAMAAFIGHPHLGANAGVMLGCLIGCAVYTTVYLKRHQGKVVLIGIAGAVAVLLSVAVVDSLRPPSQQSHLGQAINLIRHQGGSAVVGIISRKAAMNLMLLQNSPWALMLGAGCLGAAILEVLGRRRRRGKLGARAQCLWASTAALFMFNDSGVLAAGASALWLFADAVGTFLQRD